MRGARSACCDFVRVQNKKQRVDKRESKSAHAPKNTLLSSWPAASRPLVRSLQYECFRLETRTISRLAAQPGRVSRSASFPMIEQEQMSKPGGSGKPFRPVITSGRGWPVGSRSKATLALQHCYMVTRSDYT